jgi:hypothetical protein
MRANAIGMLLVIVVASYLLAFAGDGLYAYLTGDDLMNAYGYWTRPVSHLVRDTVLFYRGMVFRPVGALFYRPVFALFGLNPLPYRIVCMALMLANLGLMYVFCRRLSRSREVAALACLLGAYHAHLGDLYYNSGTIYDLICFFFFYLALIYYIRIRQEGSYPGMWQTVALLVLYIAALGSKEMAVSFPIILAAYELVFHRPTTLRWLMREGRFLLLTIPVTIGYIIGRVAGPEPLVRNESYYPTISLPVFMAAWKHYLYDLFYTTVNFNSTRIVVLWAAMLAIALIGRRRELIFVWLLIMAGALPVIFIPPRGLYAIYMTLPAWYLFFAACLVLLRDLALRFLPAVSTHTAQAALFALAALLLVPLHRREKAVSHVVSAARDPVRAVDEQLTANYPSMPRGANILFLSDPFESYDYSLTFLFRLHYRDRDIEVNRVKVLGAEPDGETRKRYQHVFRFTGDVVTEAQ